MKHLFLNGNPKPTQWFYGLLFLFLVIIDQVSKKIFIDVDNQLGFIKFRSVENSGLVFNLNFNQVINALLIFLALIFFCWQFYKNYRQRNIFLLSAYLFIIAGASSNIIDRIFFGAVKDFLSVGLDFTFNLADVYIFIGVSLLLISPRMNQKSGDE